MGKFIDLTGQRFGKLTVVRRTENGNCKQVRWECLCDCGNTHVASTASLRTGRVKSCGCLNAECHRTHGESRCNSGKPTRLYKIWDSMLYRCNSDNAKSARSYKNRGITVCDEWRNSYEAFRDWSLANGYEDHLSIDRIDNDKGYAPQNCRWITMDEQQRNKRNTHYITYKNETKPLVEWAELFHLDQGKLRWRVRAGWTNPSEILFGK